MRQTFFAIFLLIIIGLIAALISVQHVDQSVSKPPQSAEDVLSSAMPEIALTHSFIEKENGYGTHTYTGTLALPTPCHTFSVQTSVAESFPEQIGIDFTVEPLVDGEVCIQVITDVPFTVSVDASEGATVRGVTVNGRSADVTLHQAKQ